MAVAIAFHAATQLIWQNDPAMWRGVADYTKVGTCQILLLSGDGFEPPNNTGNILAANRVSRFLNGDVQPESFRETGGADFSFHITLPFAIDNILEPDAHQFNQQVLVKNTHPHSMPLHFVCDGIEFKNFFQ